MTVTSHSYLARSSLALSRYLMTVPDLPKVLAGMYNLVDSRLAVFPRLLKLCGRLDLLLSQVVLQSKDGDGDEVDMQVPVTEFIDNDDSESEESDGGSQDENADVSLSLSLSPIPLCLGMVVR